MNNLMPFLKLTNLMGVILLMLLSIFFNSKSLAQDQLTPPNITDLDPSIVTPQVAVLNKFLEVPVSHYSGVPEISVPLYNIEVDGLKIPIQLRYHSAGIRVKEEATWVGLGWDLTVGGTITQTAVGQLDQADPYYNGNGGQYYFDDLIELGSIPSKYMPSWRNESHKESAWSFYSGHLVEEQHDDWMTLRNTKNYGWIKPDLFSFSLVGGGGRFLINQENGGVYQISDKKDEYFIYGDLDSGWNVNTIGGIKYKFDNSFKEYTGPNEYPVGNPYTNWTSDPYNVPYSSIGWKLSSIALPSGKQISFSYTLGAFSNKNDIERVNLNQVQPNPTPYYTTTNSWSYYQVQYLNQIVTPKETIKFILSSAPDDRKDIKSKDNSYYARRLERIEVIDNFSNQVIKVFQFNYEFFDSGSDEDNHLKFRLKLKSIQELGIDESDSEVSIMPPFEFVYKEGSLPDKNSKSVDHWGYYNGVGNSTLIPKFNHLVRSGLINEQSYSDNLVDEFYGDLRNGRAIRGMDPSFAKVGMLHKIIYPTGGFSSFIYEPNEFNNHRIFSAKEEQNLGAVADVKIDYVEYKDTNNDGSICPESADNPNSPAIAPDASGKLVLRGFLAAVGRGGNGAVAYADIQGAYVRIDKVENGNTTTIFNLEIDDFDAYNAGTQSIGVQRDFEYTASTSARYYIKTFLPDRANLTHGESCIPKAIAVASYKIDPPAQSGNITVNSIGGGWRIKKIDHQDTFTSSKLSTSYSYRTLTGQNSGKLLVPLNYLKYSAVRNVITTTIDGDPATNIPSQHYMRISDGYLATVQDQNIYSLSTNSTGALVGYSNVTVSKVSTDETEKIGTEEYEFHNDLPIYMTMGQISLPGLPKLKNGLIKSYVKKHQNKQVLEETKYYYDDLDPGDMFFGIEISDYHYGPESYSSALMNRHAEISIATRWTILHYPIFSEWYKNYRTITNYYSGAEEMSVENTKSFNNLGQLVLSTNTYNDGTNKGLSYQYPIDHTDHPLYTTIEANKQFDLLLRVDQLKNGLVVKHTQSDFEIQESGSVKVSAISESIDGAAPYLVVDRIVYDENDHVIETEKDGQITSYIWGYDGQYPVAKIVNASFDQCRAALGGETGLNNLQSKDGNDLLSTLESLRTSSNLSDAMVNTYTYNPLVGIAIEVNPNGLKTTYEYDDYGRLEFVKDHSGNILKKHTYHYHED